MPQGRGAAHEGALGGMRWDEGLGRPCAGGLAEKIGLSSSYAPVDLASRKVRFVTDGSMLRVIEKGPNRGLLFACKHEYRTGATPDDRSSKKDSPRRRSPSLPRA